MRRVTLHPVRHEWRLAIEIFARHVGVAVVVMTLTGLAVTWAAAVIQGATPSHVQLSRAGLWFVAWTALFVGPFTAFGLGREVLRYRRARRRLGPRAWLSASGFLHSEDGRRRVECAESS